MATAEPHTDIAVVKTLGVGKGKRLLVEIPRNASDLVPIQDLEPLIDSALNKNGIARAVPVQVGSGFALTHADARLHFDEFSATKQVFKRNYYVQSDLPVRGVRLVASQGPTLTCPAGVNVEVPAFVIAGRIVDISDQTVIASFRVAWPSLIGAQELAKTRLLQRTTFETVLKSGLYDIDTSLGRMTYPYTYISEWKPIDILCDSIRKDLQRYLPSTGQMPDFARPAIDYLMARLVPRVFQ